MIKKEHLVDEKQAAEIIGVKPHTLTMWRYRKSRHLPFVRISRKIYYKKSDVEDFVNKVFITYNIF